MCSGLNFLFVIYSLRSSCCFAICWFWFFFRWFCTNWFLIVLFVCYSNFTHTFLSLLECVLCTHRMAEWETKKPTTISSWNRLTVSAFSPFYTGNWRKKAKFFDINYDIVWAKMWKINIFFFTFLKCKINTTDEKNRDNWNEKRSPKINETKVDRWRRKETLCINWLN